MKIRQGKDILIRWKVLTNGQDVSLEGRNITLVMTTPLGREKVLEHDVEGSEVVARLRGTALTHLGDYTLTLWENRGEEGQTAVDAVNAFELVKYTTMEGGSSSCSNLEEETVDLDVADMIVGIEGPQGPVGPQGPKGDTGAQGEPGRVMTYDDMTEAQKKDLASRVPLPELPDNLATKDDVNEAVSGKQDALTLTVKDNGNIVIGNISGQSKEFMPATPSGDPMHWAYVTAGAEYNDTGEDKVKDAPWKDYVDTEEEKQVVHKAGHWYLNGLGDITNEEMRVIYAESQFNSYPSENIFVNKRTRTLIDKSTAYPGISGRKYQYYNNTNIIVIRFNYSNVETIIGTFESCSKLKHISTILNVQWVLTFDNAFFNCKSLISVSLLNVRKNISFASSQFISKSSVKYMIENATPTSAITITLHPDAYARLAEDADIVAALEAKPLVTLVSA